jgi:aspartate kinase
MDIVVQKYGGSSLADVTKLRQVAARVMETAAAGHRMVVVVSAMGKTTNDLLDLAKQVSTEPPRRELDMLLTAGERISMALLSMAIRDLGGDAISFTGSQAGIITTDRHIDARITEVRPYRVQEELERGRVVIVAGYQGVSPRREITTLGRGGSDTSAVALAAALGAEWCEICSDVDGVYTADPRVVADARRIDELRYEETQEMAEAGAKVLNAQAVEFAKAKGITIVATATSSPHSTKDGTKVHAREGVESGCVTGIANEADLTLIAAKAEAHSLLAILDAHGVPAKQLHLRGDAASLLISNANLHDEARLRRALETELEIESIQIQMKLAAVSAIGTGINQSHENLQRGQHAITATGTEIVECFTSSFRITWLVESDAAEVVTQALHTEFITSRA